jgi:prepilin signal peptidase PulO-like enzyme (type II secretory pathway)
MHVLPLVLLFIFGACLGSFGSVIISRVPIRKSIGGRSQCPRCRLQVAKRDLFPILSFLLLRGKCRHCGKKISIRYPLLELGSAIAVVLPAALEGYIDPFTISLGIALWLFLLLAVMDGDAKQIPDAVTFPLLFVALSAAVLRGNTAWIAPVIGGGFFFLQWAVSRGRIMGSGDILIGIAMGLLLGTWQHTLIAIGISYIVGAVVVSVLLVRDILSRKDRIAFVPFLFAGMVVAFVCGDRLLEILIPRI